MSGVYLPDRRDKNTPETIGCVLSVHILTQQMLGEVRYVKTCQVRSWEVEQVAVAGLPEGTWETSIVWQNHCVHRSKSAPAHCVCVLCVFCDFSYFLTSVHCNQPTLCVL